jgi:hypothetical protein
MILQILADALKRHMNLNSLSAQMFGIADARKIENLRAVYGPPAQNDFTPRHSRSRRMFETLFPIKKVIGGREVADRLEQPVYKVGRTTGPTRGIGLI